MLHPLTRCYPSFLHGVVSCFFGASFRPRDFISQEITPFSLLQEVYDITIEGRVEGHVFITILAYQLLRFIQYTFEQHGDTRSWQSIKRVLQTHTYATLIVPTGHGQVYRLRKAGLPEQSHKQIYNLFGIQWQKLPVKKSMIKRKVQATL